MLTTFYREPDNDRWLPCDRFPRRLIRRIVRGPRRPGGQERVFLNLCAGLNRLKTPYRANDYRRAKNHPDELCCILGKRPLLDAFDLPNPLIVGPCCHNHPIDDPALLSQRDVRRILVPGEWMRRMCEPAWGEHVQAWPVGIDTDRWSPPPQPPSANAPLLLYNKIRWAHAEREQTLLSPIRAELQRRKIPFTEIVYGAYDPESYRQLLGTCRGMIFICEHETQGIAYQEALSSGVPILAWDHGGEWLDPDYHPHRVRFSPISSVPYWSETSGEKFREASDFTSALDRFLGGLERGNYHPRDYILSRLTLEKSARRFLQIVASIQPSAP